MREVHQRDVLHRPMTLDSQLRDRVPSRQMSQLRAEHGHAMRRGPDSLVPPNGRFLRHRFSPKPKVIATRNSLPKRNHVAKEAVSAAWQTSTRQRSERICNPNDAPRTKPRPCVKTMLGDPIMHQKALIGIRVSVGHDRRRCRVALHGQCWASVLECRHG